MYSIRLIGRSFALISVFNKDGLEPIAKKLNTLGIKIYSTGGTELFLKKIGIPVLRVEDVTGYPSILGGRVKTLHPKIHAGILNKRNNKNHLKDLSNNNFETNYEQNKFFKCNAILNLESFDQEIKDLLL